MPFGREGMSGPSIARVDLALRKGAAGDRRSAEAEKNESVAAQNWKELVAKAESDVGLRELLGQFAGACANARLNSIGEMGAALVPQSLEEINAHLREHKVYIGNLSALSLRDLPPIEWDGYQQI